MKLNLGSGYDKKENYIHVDKVDYGENIVADVLKGLPFKNEYFDFVLMNHTLQCFHYDEIPIVLKEVMRIMKHGATLRILTPDLLRAMDMFITKNIDWFPIADDIESTLSGKFARYIFWHGDTRCVFTTDSLTDVLSRNEFTEIKKGKYGDCDLDSREDESLIMESVKA